MIGDFKGARVLVTGSAGVIGCEVLQLLLKQGATLMSLDRESLPPQWSSIKHHQLDLASAGMLEIEQFNPHVVIHLAASFERAVESREFWPVNWNDNVLATHNVLEAAYRCPSLHSFVFASSYLIYSPELYMRRSRDGELRLLRETDQVSTRNLCGAAKYYAEQELAFFAENVRPNVRTPSARIFRVYGRGSRDVISRWVRALLAGQHIDVYNAGNRFDYIYAGDVAEGLLRLAAAPTTPRGPVNLGTGTPRTVEDVLRVLTRFIPEGSARIRWHGDPEPFEASGADLGLLRSYLEWTPGKQLEEGIKELIAYERAHGLTEVASA